MAQQVLAAGKRSHAREIDLKPGSYSVRRLSPIIPFEEVDGGFDNPRESREADAGECDFTRTTWPIPADQKTAEKTLTHYSQVYPALPRLNPDAGN